MSDVQIKRASTQRVARHVKNNRMPVAPPVVQEGAEAESKRELEEFKVKLREQDARQKQSFEDVTDSECWCCLCFQTREQKEEFLQKMRWMELGDKYLDGMKAAELSGVSLESRIPISFDSRTRIKRK